MIKFFKSILFFLLLIIIFVSCREKEKRVVEKIIPVQEILSLKRENAPRYSFYYPKDLNIDQKGNIYVVDTNNSRIQIFNQKGEYLRTIGEPGQGPAEFNKPESMFIDEKENKIYVSDTRNRRLQIFSSEGEFISLIKLNFAPQQVVLRNSMIYVTRFPSNMVFSRSQKSKSLIKKLNKNGEIMDEFLMPVDTGYPITNLLINSLSMTTDKKENLICAYNLGLNKIMKFNRKDTMVLKFKTIYKAVKWAKPGEFPNIISEEDINKLACVVSDITCDDKNNIYILAGNLTKKEDGSFEKAREIYRYDPGGRYTGTIILPSRAQVIALDRENHLFIIDQNFIIRKFKLVN